MDHKKTQKELDRKRLNIRFNLAKIPIHVIQVRNVTSVPVAVTLHTVGQKKMQNRIAKVRTCTQSVTTILFKHIKNCHNASCAM